VEIGTKVIIRDEWDDAGRSGILLSVVNVGQEWGVVKWDGEEDPDCCKLAALKPWSNRHLSREFFAYLGVIAETGKVVPGSVGREGMVLSHDQDEATELARKRYGHVCFAVRVKVVPA